MKNLFTALLLMFLSSSFSQSNINGIGRFKIGMDISIIDSLKNEQYIYKIFDKNKDDYNPHSEDVIVNQLMRKKSLKLQKADKIIFEKKMSSDYNDYGTFPMIENNQIFMIKYCVIAGIDVDYLQLSFRDNKLYEINFSDNLELKLALLTKYKSVRTEEVVKKVSCYNSYGNIELEETNIKDTYRDDECFYAFSSLNTYYRNCDEHKISYTSISNREINDEVFKLEKAVFKNKLEDPNREDLKALKKL